MDTSAVAAAAEPPLAVEAWPSESLLLGLVVVFSLGIWTLLAVTIFGLAYVLLIAAFLFFAHVAFVAHLRGSAVRLGPRQFPELHARVVELARRAGLAAPPEAYLLEAGGSLNAFATKLFRGRLVVLFTDLLEACGEDRAARDMVIGHELGHLKAGHLDLQLLLAPGRLTPFLGAAYSRACELTCDRWGAALCGDPAGATRGLAILAAGGAFGPQVNLAAYVAQRESLDTGWMTIGRWLSGYPPLSARVAALAPALAAGPASSRGKLRAAGILGAVVLVPSLAAAVAIWFWLATLKPLFATAAAGPAPPQTAEEIASAIAQVESDFDLFEAVVMAHRATGGALPEDSGALQALWETARPGEPYPSDPFDGLSYAYGALDGYMVVQSSGPDGAIGSEDDIVRQLAEAEGEAEAEADAEAD